MIDFNIVILIPFYGKIEERPTSNEKFLGKARHYGFKDI
jgi:hypothetical protein